MHNRRRIQILILAACCAASASAAASGEPAAMAPGIQNMSVEGQSSVYAAPSAQDISAPKQDIGMASAYPAEPDFSVQNQNTKAASSTSKATKKAFKGAAESPSAISKTQPLRVDADKMRYTGKTGDVSAQGNVDIFHLQDTYKTDYIYGNNVSRKYYIPHTVTWTSPLTRMKAGSGSYDALAEIADFNDISGYYSTYYIQAKHGIFYRNENKAIVSSGYLTTVHAVAKVPDYRLEASTIDIYPNDHYVAHDASLYIKNFKLITLSQIQGSLSHNASDVNAWSLIPQPTYNSSNGFGVKSSLNLFLGGSTHLSFFTRLAVYTSKGFKPAVGFRLDEDWGTFKLQYDKEESTLNDKHVWVEKKPELSFDSAPVFLGHSGIYAAVSASAGRWNEGNIRGSHEMWDAHIERDNTHVTKDLLFSWCTGYRKDYYGSNDEDRTNAYYWLGLNEQISPRVSAWFNYTNNNLNGNTPYTFDTYDMNHPIDFGARVQLTRLDALGLAYSIDTTTGTLRHVDLTYYRDLHSFTAWVTYRIKDNETEVFFQPKDFRF